MKQKKQLFSLAKQLYNEKFWDDYFENELIAIQLAYRKEPIIISVLGKTKQNYGFLIYRNLEELSCFFEIIRRTKLQEYESMLDLLRIQNCLSLEFKDKKTISKEEYQLIKESDVVFRGKKTWPIFVNYLPGYYPAKIDDSDVLLMIEVMERLLETAKDFQGKLDIHRERNNDSEILIRTYQKDDEYIDGLFNVPKEIIAGNSQTNRVDPILITEFEIKRVNSQKFGYSIWEMDIDFLDVPIDPSDGERSYFPLILLVVDSETNDIICSEFIKPGDGETIQRLLIQLILSENGKPAKIVVDTNHHEAISGYLESLLLRLEIEMIPIQKLPMISVVKKEMLEYLEY